MECFCRIIQVKQTEVVLLCSCDSTDAVMGSLGFILLHLTGVESMSKK
jgi:hypothetical protein